MLFKRLNKACGSLNNSSDMIVVFIFVIFERFSGFNYSYFAPVRNNFNVLFSKYRVSLYFSVIEIYICHSINYSMLLNKIINKI